MRLFGTLRNFAPHVKVEVSATHAQELMDAIEEIHGIFWAAKGREVAWVRAS